MIPLEDNFSDVISKAQRGLRLSDTELAEKARVSSQKIRQLREGEFDELAVARIAPVLGLAARQLCDLAQGRWQPNNPGSVEGLERFTTNFHDMITRSGSIIRSRILFFRNSGCRSRTTTSDSATSWTAW